MEGTPKRTADAARLVWMNQRRTETMQTGNDGCNDPPRTMRREAGLLQLKVSASLDREA
jgi:hypothetical protein